MAAKYGPDVLFEFLACPTRIMSCSVKDFDIKSKSKKMVVLYFAAKIKQ
jgi:hypothetical protein